MRHPDASPSFGYLLCFGLESIGVRYVSLEILRRAKKKLTTEREYWTLWRLLHDLVLVNLADFEVDVQEMEQANDVESLNIALLDTEVHSVQMELVRFYLYEWGFVCTSFYSLESQPSSQLLLVAIAWLLAFSRFFERQHRAILQRCTGLKQFRLPPFPNDVDLDEGFLFNAASDVVFASKLPHQNQVSLDGQVNQLHSVFGRLHCHLNELEVYARYHERLVRRLEIMQNNSDKLRDDLIPAYVLNLLAGPPTQLANQVQVLAQSIQMIKDEFLFYKWINGLVRSLTDSGNDLDSVSSLNTIADSKAYSALHAQIQEVQALFQEHAASFQKIQQGYKHELEKWTSRQKSRTRVQQMETKIAKFTEEVQKKELFDPQKLFLESQRSWENLDVSYVKNNTSSIHLATKEEVDVLQSQISTVINEIAQEYCGLQLR